MANTHIAVAAAFHYDLASPVAAAFLGLPSAQMDAYLNLSVESEVTS